MIIKHVISLCKRDSRMMLYDDGSRENAPQWLGTAAAIYPLQRMPQLDENNIFTAFDITSKQIEKIIFRREVLPMNIDFRDVVECENVLEPEDIEIGFSDIALLPLHTSRGLCFIDKAYLKPLSDFNAASLRFYERTTTDNTLYIVVKAGMILQAVIAPFDAINDKFVEKLKGITKDCEIALSIKKRKEYEIYRIPGDMPV